MLWFNQAFLSLALSFSCLKCLRRVCCPCCQAVLASLWLLGFIIAAVPLMNEDLFGNYYGRNGVCFPLHSDRQEKPTARGYSTGIFLGKLKRKKTMFFILWHHISHWSILCSKVFKSTTCSDRIQSFKRHIHPVVLKIQAIWSHFKRRCYTWTTRTGSSTTPQTGPLHPKHCSLTSCYSVFSLRACGSLCWVNYRDFFCLTGCQKIQS